MRTKIYAIHLPDELNEVIGAFASDDDALQFAYDNYSSRYASYDVCAIAEFSPVSLTVRAFARPLILETPCNLA